MTALIKTAFRNSIAESVYNEIVNRTSKYYYVIGKSVFWNGVDDTPEIPVDSYQYEREMRKNIIFAKTISANDISLVIPKHDWISGTVYDMYDDLIDANNPSTTGALSLETSKFYVVTHDYNVYKCIFNNNGVPSTEQPIGQDSTTIEYADGYRWKYMYTIPPAMRTKFVANELIPVMTAVSNQFYSSGEITSVPINDAGTGYTTPPTLTVSGDGYLAQNPYVLSGINLIDGGDGYLSTPAVTISPPDIDALTSIQATATVDLVGDAVQNPQFGTNGFGYTNTATISVAPPITGATQFVISTNYNDGDHVYHGTNYYLVVGSGTSGSSYPVHTTGTEVSGGISLTYVARRAVLSLQFVKTDAQLTAVVTAGQITDVVIADGGIGYTYATITITGDGTGGELTANLSSGDLNTAQANVELLAVDGTIEAIQVTNTGDNYGYVSVAIEGDGTGATAVATLTNNKISKIVMTNVGSGYSYANVIITGNGTGAQARAIISPNGGHGKNATNELFAKSLTLYTNIYGQKNYGIVVSNDYRQAGIIKHLQNYSNDARFRDIAGSSCVKMTATINPADFPVDSIVYQGTTAQFLVVAVSTTYILLLPLTNIEAVPGSFRNASNVTFLVANGNISQPQIDRYSGDLLFIDNRAGFSPTNEQNIVFRTIIDF